MNDLDTAQRKRQQAAERKRRQRQRQKEAGNVQLTVTLTAAQASALRDITTRLEEVTDDFSQADFLAASLIQGVKFRANAGGHLAAGRKIRNSNSVTVSRSAATTIKPTTTPTQVAK